MQHATIPQNFLSPAAVSQRYCFNQDTSRLAAETSEFHGGIAEIALGYITGIKAQVLPPSQKPVANQGYRNPVITCKPSW